MTLDGDIEMNDALADFVQNTAAGYSLILAVGAGTINDLGKYVAARLGIPYWAVPTAPSMNGYTSSIAAIKIRGVKRTLPEAVRFSGEQIITGGDVLPGFETQVLELFE